MSEQSGSGVDDLVTTVSTPNEKFWAEVRGERSVRVWFAPGVYETTSTSEMERGLTTLARLLWAAGRKDHLAYLTRTTGQLVTGRQVVEDADDAAYYDRLERLAAEGVSHDGSVRVTAVGQQHHAVTVEPGTLSRLSEEAFAAACGQAAEALIEDTERQAAQARWEVYMGTPLPG